MQLQPCQAAVLSFSILCFAFFYLPYFISFPSISFSFADEYKDEKRKLTAAMVRRLEVEEWDKERMKHFYYGTMFTYCVLNTVS